MLSVSDAFVTSRLDYCNALLGGCPASSINKLQIVQNAAARVLTRSRKYDNITQILQSLHWLPIKFRISYKILLLNYKAINDLAPAYLTNLLSRYNPTRSLRSQNSGLLVVPGIAKSTSVWIQPLNDLEMTEHLRRDDDNPSEDLRGNNHQRLY